MVGLVTPTACRATSRLSSRARVLVEVAALLSCGCATGSRGGATGPRSVPVVLAGTDCCKGGAAELVVALRDQLAKVTVFEIITPSARLERDHAAAIRAALARAHTLYLTMRMDLARRELERARQLSDGSMARGLTRAELARIHLYLAAISLAQRRDRDVAKHSEAAVRFDPKIQPDPDVFSPPVREAIEQARRERQGLEVRVQSEPSDAEVLWDSERRGKTPVTLADQGQGEHYLRLEHLLYLPWEETIRLSTSSTLQIKLKPLPRDRLAAVLRGHPELFAQASIDAQSVVWITEGEKGGLRVDRLSRDGLKTERLAAGSPPAEIERVARALVPATTTSAPPPAPLKKRGRWQRDYWIWIAAGAVTVTLAIALPVGLTRGTDEPAGRGARMRW